MDGVPSNHWQIFHFLATLLCCALLGEKEGMSFLGVEHAILQAPLGPDISGPDLVAAVANAGALGFLRAPDEDTSETLRKLIHRTRELTHKSFGVGIILSFPHEESLKAVLEEKVAVLYVSWGNFTKEDVDQAHLAGVKVVQQVGSVEDAKKAAQSGVDAIIAQGIEAGGHVCGKIGLMAFLPSVVDAVAAYNVPVIAAGGIADARGYVAALALGARGVCMGTRFVATEESYAHPVYKTHLVNATAVETEYTNLYGRSRWTAPHRVLRTPFHEQWKDKLPDGQSEIGQPIIGRTVIHDTEQTVPRFSGKVPNVNAQGDVESMVMYAGTGVGQVHHIVPAATVINDLLQGAQFIQNKLVELLESTSLNRVGLGTMV